MITEINETLHSHTQIKILILSTLKEIVFTLLQFRWHTWFYINVYFTTLN